MRCRETPGPLDYSRRLWLRLWLALTFVFLYAPIVILVVFSFNDSRRNIVWRGFTTEYYALALANDSLREAFLNSLIVAAVSTAISTVLGTMLAIALWRFRFPGKPLVEGANALPIVIPEICMGVALMVFFSRIGLLGGFGWPVGLLPVILGHVTFSFPFVAVVVRARLAGFDRALEEASLDLGASEWQTFWRVLLPYPPAGAGCRRPARHHPLS